MIHDQTLGDTNQFACALYKDGTEHRIANHFDDSQQGNSTFVEYLTSGTEIDIRQAAGVGNMTNMQAGSGITRIQIVRL